MNNKVIEFNLSQRNADTPDIRTGDVVRVHRKIKEGEKERVQIFEGMIIALKGGQSSSPMITVRKVSNGAGVEIIVPIYSPSVTKIEFVKRAKVRRSKLYYVRDKAAKALRFKFSDRSGNDFSKEAEQVFEESAAEKEAEQGAETETSEATPKEESKEAPQEEKDSTQKEKMDEKSE